MATFNTADDQARYALVPFDEAINYLGGKINQDTDKWDDLATPQEHDAAFVVAGMKGALLQDIRAEVEKAIRDGKSREDFKKEFKDIVDRRGWSSKQGNDWRSSIIYQTNLRQAYGDGRCRQMSDPDVVGARPYRMWIHGDSRVPRPEHRAMNGKVFRHDHPIAQTRLPSGFGCFLAGTEVATAKGWIAIEKILEGDLVFGGSGDLMPVISTSARNYRGKVIQIGTDNFSCSATENHRFLTLRGWVKACNLKLSDVLVNVISHDLASTFCKPTNQGIGNIDQVQSLGGNVAVPLPVDSFLSITFDANRDAINPNVYPVRRHGQVEPSIKPASFEEVNHNRFSFGGLGFGVGVSMWFSGKGFTLTNNASCSNIGIKEGGSRFKFFRDSLCPFVNLFVFAKPGVIDSFLRFSNSQEVLTANLPSVRVSDVLKGNSFASSNIQSVVVKQTHNGSLVDHEVLRDLSDGEHSFDVQEPEGFVGGYPLDLFDSLEDFRLWAIAHGRLSKVVHLHPIVYQGDVYNLTVTRDESYCLKVGVVHNCKCTWVSLSERDMKRRGLSVESGISWGSEIETAKGRKVLQIDRGFGAACKFESEREKEERKSKARKDILARMLPDTRRDATREILTILVVGAFFVGALSAKDAIFATFPNFLKFINDNLQKEVIDFRQQKHQQKADQHKQDLSQQIKTVGDQFNQPNTKPITIVVGGVGDADGKNAEFLVNQLLDNGLEGDVIFLNNQIPQINSVIKEYIISDPLLAPYAAYLQTASNLSNKEFAQFFASLPEPAKLPFRNALLRLSKDLVEKSFESGVNQIPEILGQIIKSQSTSVNFVGHSGGGLVIEDLMQVLQDIGIKSKTGISLGGLRVPIKSAPKNLRRYYSDLDFVNTIFESDKDYGDLDRYFDGIYHSRSSAPKGKELFTWQTNKGVFDQMVADLNEGYVKPVKVSNAPQPVRKNKPLFDIEVSASEIPFDDLPDVTVTLPPAKVKELRKKLGLEVESDRTLTPPMRDLPRDVSLTTRPPGDLVAPTDPILPPEPATRPAPPATLEVRKITEDELSALRQSAKRDLPFRIRVNKNKDGTFNVQPVAGDGYKWTPEQAEIVGNYLRSKGIYLSPKFDPTNAGWQEGANYLKVAFDAELPFENQPLGDLSIQTESQKTRAKAYTLQQGLKTTTDKIDQVKLDKERALERLATSLEIEEGNPFADEIAKKFDDQIKVLERRAKQQRSKIQGFILDADRFDEYERRAATTFDLQDNSSIGEGAADIIGNSVKAQELQKEVKAAIDRLPQAQRELDNLQRIEDELKLSKELIKSVVDERKAIAKQQKELIKNIQVLEKELDRGEGLIGGRSGKSLDALNQARSQLAAIEIRLPELERGENAYKGQREALQELLDQSVTSIPELNREIKGLQGEINAKSTELYNNIKLFQRLDRLKSANLGNDVPVSDGEKLDNIRVPIAEKPKPDLEKRYVRRAYADKYAAKIGGKVFVQKDENGKTIYVVVPPGGITLDG